MHIDPRIFLSRHEVPVEGAVKLSEALEEAADGANRIVILSAYFGAEFLGRLLSSLTKKQRRGCALTLIFGMETPSQLPEAVHQLRELHKNLERLHFSSLSVKIFHINKPFHVKLFYFLRTTQPTWFIGSANASPAVEGGRHELMLRMRGRHEQLIEYMESVIKLSVPVDAAEFPSAAITDLRAFFLSGLSAIGRLTASASLSKRVRSAPTTARCCDRALLHPTFHTLTRKQRDLASAC